MAGHTGADTPPSHALTLLGDVRWQGATITGERIRTLLATLVLHPRDGVTDSLLVEELWHDAPPANPTKALQVVVSRARSATHPDVITRTARGYRLGLLPDEVDVLSLFRLADEARARIDAGEIAAARAAAEAAIRLADGSVAPPEDAVPDALGRLRASAAGRCGQARRVWGIALGMGGDHEAALVPLRAAFTDDPGDEGLLSHLLRSEAVARGTGAALERYERYRKRLAGRLGTDPGPGLRALHAELLAADRPVRTGVRFDATELLGRDDDVRALRALTRSSRVTSVVGPGGIGKTRIARVVGREAEQPVVHMVELAGVGAPEDVVGEIGSALGVRDSVTGRRTLTPDQRADVRSRIAAALDRVPTLLILDNCEHVIEVVAELVAFLVASTRNLHVLTTSRAPLAIAGERVYALGQLAATDSAELFRQRAEAARPGAALPERAVSEIVTRLDGLPLAIELAAAKVRVMSAGDIATRLKDRFALLRGGDRSAPDRHQTLLAVIDWSWHLLADRERTALRRLSVFHDGFALPAAEAMLGRDALDSLQHLADQSLVTVHDTASGIRYGMLETVREFGRMRLADTGEEADAHAAQSRWAAEYADRAQEMLYSPDQIAAMDRVRSEETNLADVLRRALGQQDRDTAMMLLAALCTYWTITGEHERVTVLTDAVERAITGWTPPPDLADSTRIVLATVMNTQFMMGKEERNPVWSLLCELGPGSDRGDVAALVMVTLAADPLRGDSRERLGALCEHPDRRVAAHALLGRAHELENAGRPDAAIVDIERALALSTDEAGPWLRALLRTQLAGLHAQLGLLDEGSHHAEQALPILDRLDATDDAIGARTLIGTAALARGSVAEVEGRLAEISDLMRRRSQIGSGFFVSTLEAELALARGEYAEGLRRYRVVVRDAHELRLGNATTTGLEPWVLYMRAAALAAHTLYGSDENGADLFDTLRGSLLALLDSGRNEVPGRRILDYPIAGLAMYAIALWGLRHAALPVAAAVRLGVLAERFGYNRMLSTMAWCHVTNAAEAAAPGLLQDIDAEYGDRRGEQLLGEARDFAEQLLAE